NDSVNGQRGQLTIGASDCSTTSASTEKHDFHYGANAYCTLGQQVNTGTGNIIGILQGLNDRLKEEGKCDQLFGRGHAGFDDFNEVFALPGSGQPVVPSATNVFNNNSCYITSGQNGVPADTIDGDTHVYIPRAVDLVLINQLSPTNQTHGTATITGFAGFYVIGCFADSSVAATKPAVVQDHSNFGIFLN